MSSGPEASYLYLRQTKGDYIIGGLYRDSLAE